MEVYYVVKVKSLGSDDLTGEEKPVVDKVLVSAISVSDAETKVTEVFTDEFECSSVDVLSVTPAPVTCVISIKKEDKETMGL